MSPFPITGIFTAAFTSAMRDQSARPLYPCSRVLGCRAIACNPQFSAKARHVYRAHHCSWSFHPARNFMVNGIEIAARTLVRIRSTNARSRRQPEPPLHLVTLLTGQPKLISRMSNPRSSQMPAASAS